MCRSPFWGPLFQTATSNKKKKRLLFLCVCVYLDVTRTCTVGVCAGPGQSILAHSGGAALQLVAPRAFEITRGPVVVSVTVALHVPVIWSKQRAAAAHYTGRGEHSSEDKQKVRRDLGWNVFVLLAKCVNGRFSLLVCWSTTLICTETSQYWTVYSDVCFFISSPSAQHLHVRVVSEVSMTRTSHEM